MTIIPFNPEILQRHFSSNTRLACRSCKRFGNVPCCPPALPNIDEYRELFQLASKGILIYQQYAVDKKTWKSNWQELGRKSSIELADKLRELKKSFSNSLIYGAGSCKECSHCTYLCSKPDKMIIPIEATGINVVNFFKEITGIQLRFPVWEYGTFFRVGVLLYD